MTQVSIDCIHFKLVRSINVQRRAVWCNAVFYFCMHLLRPTHTYTHNTHTRQLLRWCLSDGRNMPVTAPVFSSTMTDDLLVSVALLLCYCCANGWLRFKSRLLLLLYAGHNYHCCFGSFILFFFFSFFILIHEPWFGRGLFHVITGQNPWRWCI